MKNFICAVALVGVCAVSAFAGEERSVLAPTPAPASAAVITAPAPVEVVPHCSNGRCCLNGKCFVKQPRFERNVSVSTTCDACGVKETNRTVTWTRRRR